jgi:hypothetical protein
LGGATATTFELRLGCWYLRTSFLLTDMQRVDVDFACADGFGSEMLW